MQPKSVNLSINMRKEIVYKQQLESSHKRRKICLSRAYLATTKRKFFKELCTELWLFILVVKLAMSPENLNGTIFILTEIQQNNNEILVSHGERGFKTRNGNVVNIDKYSVPQLKQHIQVVGIGIILVLVI